MDAPPKSKIQIQNNGGAIPVNVAGPGSNPGSAHERKLQTLFAFLRIIKLKQGRSG
jgi:hypothetical protein